MSELPEKDRQFFKEYMEEIERLANKTREPLDPKIEPLLKIIYALVQEQVILAKKYAWGSHPVADDELLDTTENIPSVDDLRRMMEEE